MQIKFESELDYQHDAINAIADIFKGQETCTSNFTVYSPAYLAQQKTMEFNQIGYANKMQLTDGQILDNVQKLQLRNGLKPSVKQEVDIKHLDFSIEMETGTGKTYVYLRTIMEMNRQYGFTKFIIVVPSIPIKEGVYKSLQITETHFKEHYNNIPYKYFIYDSSQLVDIRDFATNPLLQIMVINIDAFRKSFEDEKDEKKTANIIHRYNDKLGYKPLQLIQDTRPIVIIDEPQSTISTPLAKKAVKGLNPMAILRYSATHKEKLNQMYKLDAIDAYNKQLVKQIEVASVKVEGAASNGAYVKLISVQNKKGISAKVEVDVLHNGSRTRKVIEIKKPQDLLQSTHIQEYDGFQVNDIYTEEGNEYVEFINGTVLKLGETVGAVDETLIKRMMIRKTIQEHLDKELKLNPLGIKVLSLFFIDAVKHYRIYDEDGNMQNGDYANIFEEEYKKLINHPRYRSLFNEIKDVDENAHQVHNGYFSIDKKAKASNKKEKFEFYKDTSGTVAADEDTYNLIMKDKELLLSFDSKLRFIFSHSALKEGWDNPNVFQICTLKEAGSSEIRRRQEIGRGLRLAVNQDGERVRGFDINTLTVMASESYESFVDNLQKDFEKETGIVFGLLQTHSFNNIIVAMEGTDPVFFGQENSAILFDYLMLKGYINPHGKVQDLLKDDLRTGNLALPEHLEEHIKSQVTVVLKQTAGKLEIKRNEDKETIKVNKAVLLSPDFKELWDKIKYKTTYAVDFDSNKLTAACQQQISNRVIVSRGKLVYEKASLSITTGGVNVLNEPDVEYGVVNQEVEILPDIVTYLQNETQLTRKSIVQILKGCTNLKYFKINPQKFIEGCIEIINEQMHLHIVDGIVYTKIGEHDVYSQELFEKAELSGYLKSNMIASTRSPYEYVVYDSGIESDLASEFERNSNVKVYAKLPGWFKIDTPLGTYNPDWAVLFELEGVEKLFFVVESKGSMGYDFLRPSEQGKIECGKKHFEELANKTGSNITLEHVTNIDDFVNKAMAKAFKKTN
ncbi:type III restriction-modification system endonuclease [Mucilaginibacter flavidus]|uniref:type III restriction-modification system endonuclease n=1 Tax=Mucilaginibacter flavidus TaxID=2949309 RepID=UPI0020938B68|nr:DEAD/DEAH box helicase family protein [Mucilaginibacter flavidus]MCO5948086.1 DEAD/DEAH box helicase family protein [Mucilaginibacter flavidus]